MVNDLQGEYTRFVRAIKEISKERDIVILSAVAVIASIVSVLMSWSAVDSAKDAKAMVEYELVATRKELLVSQNRTSLYIVYVQRLHAYLIVEGLDPPPLPEE